MKLNSFVNLEKLYCSKNSLTNLDFLNNLNPEKLTNLDIRNNNFPKSDLIPFNRFINLEYLDLANNSFVGGLEPLKNMSKLRELDISDTDIDSGLEYLPKSLNGMFYCDGVISTRKTKKIKL